MALTGDLQLPAGPPPLQTGHEENPLHNLVSVPCRLRGELDSANAKAGDLVKAIFTQPVVDPQNQLMIPQNSILHGRVLRAGRSRRWGWFVTR